MEELRLQLAALTCRVASLEQRTEVAERRLTNAEDQARSQESGFEVVEEETNRNEVSASDQAGRRLLAEQIGGFLRRCVRQEFRGSSGRDRLRLSNRLWVIVAGFDGRVLGEPRVETSFALVKDLCKRGADCGRSIFVGFATKWEARIAVESAGLVIPAALRDG